MLQVHCKTDFRRLVSSTIDGTAWFDQASTDDIMDFLTDGWQGHSGASFAAYDFLDFYREGALKEIHQHLERESKWDINILMDIDPEAGLAWFEDNRPDVFERIVRTEYAPRSFA